MPTLIDMRIKSYWQIKRYAQTWGYKSINIQRCRRFRETQISRCRQRHVSCKLYLYKLGTSWACYGWMLLELFYFLSTLEVYLGRCFKQDRVALRSPLLTRIKEALHDPHMILQDRIENASYAVNHCFFHSNVQELIRSKNHGNYPKCPIIWCRYSTPQIYRPLDVRRGETLLRNGTSLRR